MTSTEIKAKMLKDEEVTHGKEPTPTLEWLKEIAYQLAKLNEKQMSVEERMANR